MSNEKSGYEIETWKDSKYWSFRILDGSGNVVNGPRWMSWSLLSGWNQSINGGGTHTELLNGGRARAIKAARYLIATELNPGYYARERIKA